MFQSRYTLFHHSCFKAFRFLYFYQTQSTHIFHQALLFEFMACSSSFSEFERGTFTVSIKKSYDAFINHRGPDTKETVAFALYDSLEEKGFKTFLDDQELQLGDSIEPAITNAIYSSSVQIAVFSPRYAESPWCLNELVDMLKTHALFIPVFCDVEPFEVRFPDKGVYKDAFAKHEEKGRFSKETLDDWKSALHSSSLVSGYEFSTSNDNVETLCSKIALAVQEKVGNTFLGFPRYVEDVKLPEASAPAKKTSLLPRDSHPVGIDSKFEDMKGLLNNPENQVIAVVGMGGFGKTFLLQYVFNALKSRYQHSIWLSISRSYSVKSLQRDIASHIGLSHPDVSEERAAVLIHDCLQGKRCLIVLDDLWTVSTEDNLLDKLGLPGDKDCKVVVSSRNREVATNLKAHIYEMRNLSDKDSWELFCFYAFPDCKENRAPSQLEEVGRGIVKQCGNLPLAIKTTAASLGNTKSLSKWESKLHQLEKAVIPFGEHDPVMDILRLSYDSLPAHLKACFAFLSFFPEDEKIDCEDLVYLWIAEGLIPAGEGEEQWDMAWNWFDQLAQLCLLQLWEDLDDDIIEGTPTKYCAIHDLLHDLAINICRENKCVFSLEEASAHANGPSTVWCRILLAKKDMRSLAFLSLPAYVRTLSLSQNWDITSIPNNLFTAMRGLRVLDLSRTGICTLPESVGKMILLKVLNLRGTSIKKVPECVRYLKSLLFLALPYYVCLELPVWITELRCLQHLECWSVNRMPKGTSKLVSLRTLRTFIWVKLECIEEDLAYMTELQEISIEVEREREVKRIEEGLLAHLTKMRRLGIRNEIGVKKHLPEKIRTMKHLESLALTNFVVPSWICDLANLRELELHDCECTDYGGLEGMPNLVKLVLRRNDWCSKLPKAFGKSGAFPCLRVLRLQNFYKLEELPQLEEGAMACLEDLCLLGEFPCLKRVGGALECLKTLKKFTYFVELVEKLEEGGEYLNKIKALNPYLTIIEESFKLGVLSDFMY